MPLEDVIVLFEETKTNDDQGRQIKPEKIRRKKSEDTLFGDSFKEIRPSPLRKRAAACFL
ncbi:MAG: hypothetical protein EA357_01515 [Micavibrio sp.]|nr:MAG: hypothetical protein EA357_01515 [Micavibrio sp.]